jgi:hypothetical protein
MMYVYVCFDIEDLVHPGADDVARDIAGMLADDGIVASMCVVGEKARLWERRDRQDVIAAVGQHDVGLHTDLHSVHPTVSEYLADKGWAEGVAEALQREGPGARDLARIFGTFPSTWGTAGSSWAPQIPSATQRLGISSNIYSFALSGETGASWFAGQLCYHTFVGLPGGEDACCDDAVFETALPRLLQQIEARQRRGFSCVGLFAGHPTRFRYTVFWDELNFKRGQNLARDAYRFAPRREDAEYAVGLGNLRRMLLAVRDLPGVEMIPIRALNNRFALETDVVAWADLCQLARNVIDNKGIDAEDPLASPAQKLDVLARAVLRSTLGEALPTHLILRRVLGPVAPSPPLSEPLTIDRDLSVVFCRTLVGHIDATGHLPTSLTVNGVTLGPGPLLRGIAALYLKTSRGSPRDWMTFEPAAEEPSIASPLANELHQHLPNWPPHRTDLRLDNLALHTRLQSWSLKPATLAT